MIRRFLLVGLVAGTALAPVARAADASFTLVNHGQAPIRDVFVTPAGDANWRRNRLNGKTVAPGASFEVRRRKDNNCIMDVRVVYADNRVEDRRNLNTCTLDTVTVGDKTSAGKAADDPSFRLINRGNRTISEFFATPSGMTNWGENRLDAGGLTPTSEKRIEIPRNGNCLFDLRVVFADHKAVEKRRDDLCRITDLPVP